MFFRKIQSFPSVRIIVQHRAEDARFRRGCRGESPAGTERILIPHRRNITPVADAVAVGIHAAQVEGGRQLSRFPAGCSTGKNARHKQQCRKDRHRAILFHSHTLLCQWTTPICFRGLFQQPPLTVSVRTPVYTQRRRGLAVNNLSGLWDIIQRYRRFGQSCSENGHGQAVKSCRKV